MSEFTKGPWRVAEECKVDHLDVVAQDGRRWQHSSRSIFCGDMKVADVAINICTSPIGGYPTAQSRSDMMDIANLIAAAPDLLSVVEELEESAGYWSEYDVPLGIVDRLRAAIAKAKGDK